MEPKTIAHFRTGIGNFVLFTPALQAMASMDASGKIDLCTDPIWTDYRKNSLLSLWECLPFINRVLSIKEIDESKYTTWFWTAWTSANTSRELFHKKHYYDPPDWNQNVEHECDYYMRIARTFYGYKGPTPQQMIIPSTNPVINKEGKKLVVLCDGGFGDIKVFKKWPGYSHFVTELKNFYPASSVVKIGYGEELKNVDADYDYVGKLSMAETAKVISQADIVVSTDSGCMHIADAMNIPLIVLWGGSSMSKNKPIQTICKIIHLGLACQDMCQIDGSYRVCDSYSCITDITIGEVMFYIRNFFNKGNFNVNS